MKNYKDVKWMQDYGQDVANLFGKIQPTGEFMDFYAPSNANWAYRFLIVKLNGRIYEVMTQFGAVVGGRELFLADNKGKGNL